MTQISTRRGVIVLAGLTAAGLGIWQSGIARRLLSGPDFEFKTLAGLDGYRLLDGGGVTFGGVPLFGLDGEEPVDLSAAERRINGDLCGALFGPLDPTKVPVAYFYDYQCAICRRLSPRLRDLNNVAIRWHDLAGLGPASIIAARAAIGARKQGAFDAFHDRLMRAAFQPNEGYVRALADSIGIDADRLLRDMAGTDVTDQMWISRALANKFAMLGTPGMVIGKTVVIGDISSGDLTRLIALESGATCS